MPQVTRSQCAVEQHLRRRALQRLGEIAPNAAQLQIAQSQDRDQLPFGRLPLRVRIFEAHLRLFEFDLEQQRIAARPLTRLLQSKSGLMGLPRDVDPLRQYLPAPPA